MYSFAHELGYRIKPSPLQTDLGRKMWNSFRRQKLPFAKETKFEYIGRRFTEIMGF